MVPKKKSKNKKMKFNNKVVDMTNIPREEEKIANNSSNISGVEPESNEEAPKSVNLPANSSSGLGLCDN